MAAPREIIDGLESILDVFVSNIQYRERVVFILCDNLVELACKTKALQRDQTFNRRCLFRDAWSAPGVQLAPNGLGGRVQARRDVRNTMQHGNAAVTVSTAHCADAIKDVCRVVDNLWPSSTRRMLRPSTQLVLRIADLYSSGGDTAEQQRFEDAMRQCQWRGVADERMPRVNEVIIESGLRINWHDAVRQSPELVEQILDSLHA